MLWGVVTHPGLVTVALLFTVVTGANDGGAILANGLKLPSLRPWVALLALAVSLVAVPLLVGTAVAATFTGRLVAFGTGTRAQAAVVVGVLCALGIVILLTRAGRPTSLTLATVGGLTGAGLGAGLPVSLPWVALVLVLGLAAPFVGAAAAVLLSGVVRRIPRLGQAHRLGFVVQCVAYASNDGQKMYAVFAVAALRPSLPLLLVIVLLFAVGAVYGLPRAGLTLGGRLVAVRPVHAISAEYAAATAVLGCAALGVPVSMTQAVAGGLVGAGLRSGAGRVRWPAASKIILAWLLTLPSTVFLACLLSLAFLG